jgi:flavodoxin short chain
MFMSKVAVVYWSGTGNTQAMAEALAQGITSAGGEVTLLQASEFSSRDVSLYDAFAFGCPSLGNEVLEEGKFQPMWDDVKSQLAGKKVGLFGSYGWGGGIWMTSWASETSSLGIQLVNDGVICCGSMDDETEQNLLEMAKSLA